jgi:hypothetical protein
VNVHRGLFSLSDDVVVGSAYLSVILIVGMRGVISCASVSAPQPADQWHIRRRNAGVVDVLVSKVDTDGDRFGGCSCDLARHAT